MTSSLVLEPTWDRSHMMPTRFISATISRPKPGRAPPRGRERGGGGKRGGIRGGRVLIKKKYIYVLWWWVCVCVFFPWGGGGGPQEGPPGFLRGDDLAAEAGQAAVA